MFSFPFLTNCKQGRRSVDNVRRHCAPGKEVVFEISGKQKWFSQSFSRFGLRPSE